MKRSRSAFLVFLTIATVTFGGASALVGTCGPFTDTAADTFCPFVLEVFYMGITTGTTPTTYEPAANVTRLQMAAFLSRSVDGVLKRGSRRAALNRYWTTQGISVLGLTTLTGPQYLQSDGQDLWVSNGNNTVDRVRSSDGKRLETWTGAGNPNGVLSAGGRVFVAGTTSPGRLYMIDPSQPAGAVTTVASNVGNYPYSISYDGARIWTSLNTSPGGVSIVTPGATIPWTVTTVTTGFQYAFGMLFDGTNVWVTDNTQGTLLRLDGSGAILQTVTVGPSPAHPVFDGTNIWIPNYDTSSTVTVVRASSGAVLQTLTGNGLYGPFAAAFDGQRILVTNPEAASVSLWKAANLSPIGTFPTGGQQAYAGVCSDGVDFWIALTSGSGQIARF